MSITEFRVIETTPLRLDINDCSVLLNVLPWMSLMVQDDFERDRLCSVMRKLHDHVKGIAQ